MPAVAPSSLIALTGATGFIGRHLLQALTARGYRVRVLLRRPVPLPVECASAVVGDLARPVNMSAALADAEAVIHSAGLAHAMSGTPEDDFRALNTDATVSLARAAARAGVKRFVFLSSIGAQTGPTAAEIQTEETPPQPTEAYGRSKLAAEDGLATLDLDWVALRPPLVYGRGAPGNMARLIALARTPYPLPFGALTARRSLLGLDNLADAIVAVLSTKGTLARPLLVADADPLTLPQMIAALRRGLGRRPGLLPVPAPLVRRMLRLAGREADYARLNGALVVDAAALRALGWTPRIATADGLAALMRRETLAPASPTSARSP